MRLTNTTSDDAVLAELGERMTRQRLERRITQTELAAAAGVAKRTVERAEAGEAVSLRNFVRILRALDLVEGFEQLLPTPPPSPVAHVRAAGRTPRRVRARSSDSASGGWTWKAP
jgi:transcriptional regulator with XRE-family HTH domain